MSGARIGSLAGAAVMTQASAAAASSLLSAATAAISGWTCAAMGRCDGGIVGASPPPSPFFGIFGAMASESFST